MVAAWDSKYGYDRPRPSAIKADLKAVVPNPLSPSYPAEYAAATGAAAEVLAYLIPDRAASFGDKAEGGRARALLAGVNYPSDAPAGVVPGSRLSRSPLSAPRPTAPTRNGPATCRTSPASGPAPIRSSEWPAPGCTGQEWRMADRPMIERLQLQWPQGPLRHAVRAPARTAARPLIPSEKPDLARFGSFLVLRRWFVLDRLPVLGQPLPSPLNQVDRVSRPLLRRHLRNPVRDRAGMLRVDVLRRLAVTAIEDRGRRGHLRRGGGFLIAQDTHQSPHSLFRVLPRQLFEFAGRLVGYAGLSPRPRSFATSCHQRRN